VSSHLFSKLISRQFPDETDENACTLLIRINASVSVTKTQIRLI